MKEDVVQRQYSYSYGEDERDKKINKQHKKTFVPKENHQSIDEDGSINIDEEQFKSDMQRTGFLHTLSELSLPPTGIFFV